MKQILLYGVKINGVTIDEAVEFALRERDEACTVVTPNAIMLDACRREPRYADLLNRATLSLADGIGTVMAAKRRRNPLPCRVAGIEFGERLMQNAAETGLRVFLLGGAKGIAEQAAARLVDRSPNLCICGTYHGYFDKAGEENERVCELIRAAAPDLLFICFGFPVQEEWMLQNVPTLPSVRVAAGLGGSLDVWSGNVRRAPRPIRALHLEWAWRMLREPRRLRQLPALLRVLIGKRA